MTYLALAKSLLRRLRGEIDRPAELPADWRELWEERAAIMEYDGGLPREHAELAALDDVLATMRRAGAPVKHNEGGTERGAA